MSQEIQHPRVQRSQSIEPLPEVMQEPDKSLDGGLLAVLFKPPAVSDTSVGSMEQLGVKMKSRIQLLQVWWNGGDHQPGRGLGVGQLEPLLIGYHGQNLSWLLHLQCLPDLVAKSLHSLLGG